MSRQLIPVLFVITAIACGVCFSLVVQPATGDTSMPSEEKTAPNTAKLAQSDRNPGSLMKFATGRLPLRILKITSPVKAGSTATALLQTEPDSLCSIILKPQTSDASPTAQKADKDGKVALTWQVAKSCPPGDWPFEVVSKLASGSGWRHAIRSSGVATSIKVEK